MNPPKALQVACLATLAGVVLLASGCGGINNSVGVSPASFLIPGLIMKEPAPASPQPADTNTVVVAQSP